MESTFKRINIEFIEQSKQRYDTLGDYWETPETIEFRISILPKYGYSFYVLLHELWEKYRNDKLGITDKSVDEFDMSHSELDDPGLSLEAPYHKTHMEADVLERMAVLLDGEDWVEYENIILGKDEQ